MKRTEAHTAERYFSVVWEGLIVNWKFWTISLRVVVMSCMSFRPLGLLYVYIYIHADIFLSCFGKFPKYSNLLLCGRRKKVLVYYCKEANKIPSSKYLMVPKKTTKYWRRFYDKPEKYKGSIRVFYWALENNLLTKLFTTCNQNGLQAKDRGLIDPLFVVVQAVMRVWSSYFKRRNISI